MITKSPIITGLFTILTIFFASTQLGFTTELSDTKAHGVYIGIDPISASRGASFEESKVRFSLDSKGITLWQTIVAGNSSLEFQIHHSPKWVFHLKGWGVDDCLALRQHQGAKLAQLLFCFIPHVKQPYDVVMYLGEGMPAVLGVFVREEKGYDALRKLYGEVHKPVATKETVNWLKPIDLENAKRIMRSGTLTEKIKVLEDSGHNLWTGSEKEIHERLGLIAIGLNDPHPKVQYHALAPFILGGRVIYGVELVANFLKRYISLKTEVLERALEAASTLLYEAHNFNQTIVSLEKDFGTSDIATIHKMANGFIIPEQYKALMTIAKRPPQLRWTIQHQVILRNAITKVITDPAYTHTKAGTIGAKALAEYPLPTP